jgi:hypothetical protein
MDFSQTNADGTSNTAVFSPTLKADLMPSNIFLSFVFNLFTFYICRITSIGRCEGGFIPKPIWLELSYY